MSDGAESPSVTTMLGAAGACPEIRHDGKTWKIGHPTQRAKACLEQLAVASAFDEVEALEATLPPQRYQKAYRELLASVAAREYKTWGPGWQRVVWGPMSAQLFLLSLLRENHPDATEDDALTLAGADPGRVSLALAQVIPSFLALLLSDRKDVTPEQREKIMGVAAQIAKQFGTNPNPSPTPSPNPTPPAPTPETTATPSSSGTKPSRKNRGASVPSKLPA